MREAHFMKTWKLVNDICEITFNENHNELAELVFNHVIKFRSDKLCQILGKVPTIWLLAGSNKSDYPIYTSIIVQRLRRYSRMHVATVSGVTCSRSVNHIVRSIVEQVLHKSSYNSLSCTLSDIERVYAPITDDEKPQLVVVLEDFEKFDGNVISNFIYIAKNYTKSLNLVILSLLGTTTHVLSSKIPRNIASLMKEETVKLVSSAVCIDKIVEKVLVSDVLPFHISSQSYRFLFESYEYYTYSVSSFVYKLKFFIMEHFERTPISWICYSDVDEDEIQEDDLNMFHLIIGTFGNENPSFDVNYREILSSREASISKMKMWSNQYKASKKRFDTLFKLYMIALRTFLGPNKVKTRYEFLRVLESKHIAYLQKILDRNRHRLLLMEILKIWNVELEKYRRLQVKVQHHIQILSEDMSDSENVKAMDSAFKFVISILEKNLKPVSIFNPIHKLFVADNTDHLKECFNPNILLSMQSAYQKLLKDTGKME